MQIVWTAKEKCLSITINIEDKWHKKQCNNPSFCFKIKNSFYEQIITESKYFKQVLIKQLIIILLHCSNYVISQSIYGPPFTSGW